MRHSIFLMNPILFLVYKFRKCSPVADKRLRSGLKAQQAHSPGQRPGLISRRYCALKGQKRLYKRLDANAFALSGRTSSLPHTQGDALGYVLVAPSGRALNACACSLIQFAKLEFPLPNSLFLIEDLIESNKSPF